MRVALVRELGGIGGVELSGSADPTPAAGQAVLSVRGAGVGPWDVAMISGAFRPPPLPFIPGLEVAGVVESVGDGADVQPGDQVYANLRVAGGGFAERALVSVDHLPRKPDRVSFQEAVGLVVGGGTAYEGLVDRGRLQAGETVLVTAAAGGSSWSALQPRSSGASRAYRSAPTPPGSGWKRSAGWSTWAGCAPRSKPSFRSSRCARRWSGSRADTRAARSCYRSGNSPPVAW